MAMREQVAVLNADHQPYTETWKGDNYVIPAQKAIKMHRSDALAFCGSMSETDPRTSKPVTKRLHIIPLSEAEGIIVGEYAQKLEDIVVEEFICHFDGKKFSSQEALDAHIASLQTGGALEDPNKAPLDKQDPTGEVTCPFCGKEGLKGAVGLRSHITNCPLVKNPSAPSIPEAKVETVSDPNVIPGT